MVGGAEEDFIEERFRPPPVDEKRREKEYKLSGELHQIKHETKCKHTHHHQSLPWTPHCY